jgi:nucleotide-binding universal stress UspA family protein
MTGWKRLMIGSISNAVIAKSSQPVLVVKQTQPPAEAPIPWRRLLVATGGSPWSDAAVDHALSLAQVQGLTVHMLYVEPGKSRYPREAMLATSEGKNVLALAEARAVAARVDYETELAYGHPVGVILDTATRYGCDVILLGSRGLRGWKRVMLGSVSNAIAAKASQPVLIVKRFFAE